MTVYVGQAIACNPNQHWRWRRVAHLFYGGPDEVDGLHVFATSLGLRRSWFHEHLVMPHYDLTVTMRQKALRMGATEASLEIEVIILRSWERRQHLVEVT